MVIRVCFYFHIRQNVTSERFMTETEHQELNEWIAEHVMGWHRMTNAQAMGIVNFEGFTESESQRIEKLSDQWYDSENKHAAYVVGECDCGHQDISFKPTTYSAAAMEVLDKILERRSIEILKGGGFYQINIAGNSRNFVTAETLPMVICKTAKKLFSK